MPEMYFTDHAIKRYRKLINSVITYEETLSTLDDLAIFASSLKEKTISGETIWVTEDPNVRFVTKYDDGIVCVIFLSKKEFVSQKELDYELALLQLMESEEHNKPRVIVPPRLKNKQDLHNNQEFLIKIARMVLNKGLDASLHVKAAEDYLSKVIEAFGKDSDCVRNFLSKLENLNHNGKENEIICS